MIVREPQNAQEVISVMCDQGVVRSEKWYQVMRKVQSPNFSVAQMKEYQSDMWEYVLSCTRIYMSHHKGL